MTAADTRIERERGALAPKNGRVGRGGPRVRAGAVAPWLSLQLRL